MHLNVFHGVLHVCTAMYLAGKHQSLFSTFYLLAFGIIFHSVLASSLGATADQSPRNCPFAAERSNDGNGEMSAGLEKCG